MATAAAESLCGVGRRDARPGGEIFSLASGRIEPVVLACWEIMKAARSAGVSIFKLI